jgi:CDP-diacylglycerol--serine O-phosphatidyltransferase
MIRQIPNLITLFNLFLGTSSIILTLTGFPLLGGWFIIFAAIFDFFDGLAARILDAKSEMGNILDSLADLVSFGVAPAVVLFTLLENTATRIIPPADQAITISYVAVVLALAAAWRLARFSIQREEKAKFSGLPAPAAGLFIASLPLIKNRYKDIELLFDLLSNQLFLMAVAVLIALLMISKLPLLSMKFRNLTWNDNASRYILIIISLILIALIQCAALPLIIISYIILSLMELNSLKPIKN